MQDAFNSQSTTFPSENFKSVQTTNASDINRSFSQQQNLNSNDYFNIDVEAHFKLNKRDSIVKASPVLQQQSEPLDHSASGLAT